jgi:protocatechuate 3,4-dioxygenase beta subunit
MIMLANCQAQEYELIGTCEGCEAIFEYGDRELSAIDTLVDFPNSGPKLKISGTVYESDEKTPAENVILYIYHTNQEGIYPTKGDEKGWAKRHGYIRGWIKTDKNGKYTFYTLKPGTYPSRNQPAHIHITLLEPNGKYYWINSYYFEDDPLLTDEDKNNSLIRGGAANILNLKKENHLLIGNRDIILGKNVPGYR